MRCDLFETSNVFNLAIFITQPKTNSLLFSEWVRRSCAIFLSVCHLPLTAMKADDRKSSAFVLMNRRDRRQKRGRRQNSFQLESESDTKLRWGPVCLPSAHIGRRRDAYQAGFLLAINVASGALYMVQTVLAASKEGRSEGGIALATKHSGVRHRVVTSDGQIAELGMATCRKIFGR